MKSVAMLRAVPATLVVLAACGGPPATAIDASGGTTDTATTDTAVTPPHPFSFVIVGCNRLQKGDITSADPSTANLAQLDRTFADIAALSPPPELLFFAGDMVYGFTDAPTLQTELQAWVAHYEASPLPALGIELVAVPGNHEMQNKNGSVKLAYPEAETTWVSVMAPYIRGANGPGAGGPDHLQTDQSKLDYSFDHAGSHFVVLDTDPVGADGSVPTTWVAADVTAARAAGAAHVFAIGHKPAYPSPLSTEGGFTDMANRDAFWAALEQVHADAMLAAHNHLWYKTRPVTTWQIVAGNGGSQLESATTGAAAYFGFTLVEVDTTVTVKSYGRDVPSSSYFAPAPAAQYPTTIRETVPLD